ncbi:DUF2490 domain-containing protein [Xanthomonas melonis]|uniref:DUF2490 domain-containing protein n=1 Tax=Xanthomonas melonis TaxID=56456 RepID=A0A2S7DJN4_9XANT|nr:MULTISPECIES: DUF2490 domain-containing protein [Xanthomonas]MCC4585772.1 DUF2490 domain-containing protein [Xanthomonas sp. NCPPB 1067]MCC4599136.1 DUF2490 domain-containing protein [Xanthomonas melonis]MCD0245839.1 DUF2490 domain-containing protein [Xanthomonas melonis]MCD0257965.1 DUF2490 domain-containing protein [Xanthomonas melonis]MCD0266249.1 DUF2490 domain-containing protein [Xanthomonas melonis]
MNAVSTLLAATLRIACPAALLTLASIYPAHASTEEDGRYWLSIYAQGKLPVENLYWSMDIHPRWREEGEQFDQLILRPAVFYRLNPKASVWMGYDTIISHPAGQPSNRENRWWGQFQYQFDPVANISITSRTRLEQRHREDFSDEGYRVRQMIRATRPSSLAPQLSWVVFDEVFVNLDQTSWGARRGLDQNRLFVGINWKFNAISNVDVGYLNQFVNTRAVDRENHVLMTTFRFNF